MTWIDYLIVVVSLLSVVLIGAWATKRASPSAEDFFLSGRTKPWWLLGFSMVACTFSCDTLKDAQNHPEKYPQLIVRIWGWSAYFVELDRAYQNHVIARTEYAL